MQAREREKRQRRPAWRVALAAGALAALSATVFGQPAADGAEVEDGVDATLAPGDDFFGWANGAWLAATPAPAGTARVSAYRQTAALAAQQRQQVITEAAAAGLAQPSTAGRQVAAFMAAWRAEPGTEERALAAAAPLLRQVDALQDKSALARWLGRHLRADTDPMVLGPYASAHLFGLAVVPGLQGEPQPFACLVQGGLALGSREVYLDPSETGASARQRLREQIAHGLEAAGYDRASRRAEAVLALEIAIARAHADDATSAADSNAGHRWRRSDFARRAPGLDWPAFFGAAGLGRKAEIVVWQPAAVQALAALVGSQPLALWQDYLRFHLLQRHAEVRPEGALAATEAALPDAVARLYVARHFAPPAQARVQAILQAVTAAFSRRVAVVPWLSPATKRVALAKLKAVRFGVGHPEPWPEVPGPAFDPTDAFGNLRRADEWQREQALQRLRRPLDRAAWFVPPQSALAVLHFQLNAYNFAAGLLQPPKFDTAASEPANFGAIGAILGHELSHFVDPLGAGTDARGAAREWWTAADRAHHAQAVQPLVAQFDAYRPFADLALDGRRTQTENVADLAGLASAFDAWRGTPAAQVADAAALRRMDRAFFIGFARSWRARAGEAALREQVAHDVHAPERWRVATVRNLDAWYAAFDVRPGQALYLPPEQRVRVW